MKSFFLLQVLVLVLVVVEWFGVASAQRCGWQDGGSLCQGNKCCSQWGWCGLSHNYCSIPGCQSQCSPVRGMADIVTQSTFEQMLAHRNDSICPAKGFYTYKAFLQAAQSFADFGNTGNIGDRKRELAAFFGTTAYHTSGWSTAPDSPFAWGYCRKSGGFMGQYCVPSAEWPCVPGKDYRGRGPMNLAFNDNYGACGKALGVDLLKDPDLVERDPVIAFQTALWIWMTPEAPKPSCHDVMTGIWTPSRNDRAVGRLPGFGLVTNILNDRWISPCGVPTRRAMQDRIEFYVRWCLDLLVDVGDNLECNRQKPYYRRSYVTTMSLTFHHVWCLLPFTCHQPTF